MGSIGELVQEYKKIVDFKNEDEVKFYCLLLEFSIREKNMPSKVKEIIELEDVPVKVSEDELTTFFSTKTRNILMRYCREAKMNSYSKKTKEQLVPELVANYS